MTLALTEALLGAAAAAAVADQCSKALAGRLLADGRFHPIAWRSGFVWLLNARGSLVAMPLHWAIFTWLIALAAAAGVWAEGSQSLSLGAAIGLGLVLGGATSNLGDRVVRGAVADFIAVGAWPPFNLADAAMVAGIGLLAGSLLA
jgi:signal peptidase II